MHHGIVLVHVWRASGATQACVGRRRGYRTDVQAPGAPGAGARLQGRGASVDCSVMQHNFCAAFGLWVVRRKKPVAFWLVADPSCSQILVRRKKTESYFCASTWTVGTDRHTTRSIR